MSQKSVVIVASLTPLEVLLKIHAILFWLDDGSEEDIQYAQTLLRDPEVQLWMKTIIVVEVPEDTR